MWIWFQAVLSRPKICGFGTGTADSNNQLSARCWRLVTLSCSDNGRWAKTFPTNRKSVYSLTTVEVNAVWLSRRFHTRPTPPFDENSHEEIRHNGILRGRQKAFVLKFAKLANIPKCCDWRSFRATTIEKSCCANNGPPTSFSPDSPECCSQDGPSRRSQWANW